MTFKDRLRLQRSNAKKCIKQIRAGEWVPKYNSLSRAHITANRDNKELWLSNGSFFCGIEGGNYFGIFRHWVYYAAARKLKVEADRKVKPPDVPVL
ncbi:MAG TPA: hypothetical protein DCS09_09810 [Porphyromonadaceae bacterium]|nr:hypothetical protein [Porphyromonadaceae bacterium]